ncbi:MAG: nitroreductase, partial [Planctomycetota bacterium]|nr:nitroreductase [Planctomycetota bacterium]
MDLLEAVRSRKSIRAFKSTFVSQTALKEIIEAALRAPSWGNTQPWEFAIVIGEKLEAIKKKFAAKASADEKHNLDVAAPLWFPEPFDSRRRAIGRKTFELKEIDRKDMEKRRYWELQGLGLFGAPAVIYICTDRSFYFQEQQVNAWALFDCGMIAENIMLLAAGQGLGTVPQIQAVGYPNVLREVLKIPDSKLIVLGI